MKFEITELRGSTIWNLFRMRDRIQLDPEYQRLSDVWTQYKREFLIDTVLNDFDIPKIYLHKFREPLRKGGKSYDYAIIDGKQRLETLWGFIDGKMALADDFEYFKDSSVNAAGMKYTELGEKYPDLKAQFDGFQLTGVCVETDDIEMIEEMFSRLNESAPLTAPEKRNAYGGPLPVAIRRLAREPFFKNAVPFPNKRYRHFDLAAKFLYAEQQKKVVDTKKAYLDKFVNDFSSRPRNKMPSFVKRTQENIARMAAVFTQPDSLLHQVGMIMLYYHLFRLAHAQGWAGEVTRKRLFDFDVVREKNRRRAEQDITQANYDLIEFDRYAQSPNDAYAIKFRLKVLLKQVFAKDVSTDDL